MNHNPNMEEPRVSVGIMSSSTIKLELNGLYLSRGTYMSGVITREMVTKGAQEVSITSNGRMAWDGKEWETLCFIPLKEQEADFVLKEVTIGVDFHWQRKEDQRFKGALELIIEEERVTAVNHVLVEDYLTSVISSEMSASASEELLKAHAVISRSWLLASMKSIEQKYPELKAHPERHRCTMPATPDEGKEQIKWFERDAHTRFDVCADDHCQRYQGLTRVIGENARKVIDQTWGQLLCYGGEICDARFSKSCGGVMELFSTCWEDRDYPYLQALPDTPDHDPAGDPFCLVRDKKLLSQLLNDYDLEGFGANGWDEEYTLEELSSLIESKSGRHIGRLEALTALEKGPSGRVKKLLVQGSEGHFTVGKELEIRRILSRSHLKSSDFEAIFEDGRVRFHGKGWGHGVGLCQIGAAVMAERGYDYRAILQHYYPGSEIIDRQ